MTIPLSTPSYDHYSGNNTLSVYPITFPTYEASTIEVFVTNTADWSHITGEIISGLEVFTLVLDTDFSLQNLALPNTTITLIDGGQDYLDDDGFLAAGYFLFVEFISNPMRPSTLSSGNQLVPALSKDLDRLTMHVKALDHKVYEGFRGLPTLLAAAADAEAAAADAEAAASAAAASEAAAAASEAAAALSEAAAAASANSVAVTFVEFNGPIFGSLSRNQIGIIKSGASFALTLDNTGLLSGDVIEVKFLGFTGDLTVSPTGANIDGVASKVYAGSVNASYKFRFTGTEWIVT